MSENCAGLVVECATTTLTQIPLMHPVAPVSDRQDRTAAGEFDTVTSADLLEQVRGSRFRHQQVHREHIGNRASGALAFCDFEPFLSPSAIHFARAYTVGQNYSKISRTTVDVTFGNGRNPSTVRHYYFGGSSAVAEVSYKELYC